MHLLSLFGRLPSLVLILSLLPDGAVAQSQESDSGTQPHSAAPSERSKAEAQESAAQGSSNEDNTLLEDEEQHSRPPKKGMGVLWGVVKDALRKEPLPEASVSVLGTKQRAIADEEGRYRLELPPGTYTLRFFYELHRPALVKEVAIRGGVVDRLDGEVTPDEAAVETFEVETQADASSVEGQVLSRQRAATVGDGVGRSEMAKTPAANAAQAVQRVVGATVVGNRFVYVRGLGERYTNALLNDAPLPSPEPDRAAIPLDLFPSLILDNLTIVKTFAPDVPGDFAGGSVRIQTRDLPTKPVFQAAVGLGFDDRATFRSRLAQRGSSTDFMGFDSGLRAVPASLSDRSIVQMSPEEQVQVGREINSYMSSVRRFTLPNHAFSVVAGNGWGLPHNQRIGALLTINYGRAFTLRDDVVLRTFQLATNTAGSVISRPANDYRAEFGNDRVNWGSLGTVSYWPSQRHRVSATGFHTQIADASAQLVSGYNESRSADIANTRLRYISRTLNLGQLRGEHDFPAMTNARLDWNATLARASRSEPDTRDTIFQSTQGSDYRPIATPENGSHFFSEQAESTRGAGLDWTQPLSNSSDTSKLKFGMMLNSRSRDFWAKRFHLASTFAGGQYSCGAVFFPGCPDGLYTNDNIGTSLALAEDTRPEDAYRAALNVYAGYVMLDLALMRSLRVFGGARLEATRQSIDPYSQFAGRADPPGRSLNSADALPAMGLVFSATKRTKMRASVSRTLARPQIRELSPFVFTDYFGARAYGGNPDLKLTHINNADLRFEYFPTQSEVMAFSFFYKDFQNPIENVVLDSGAEGTLQPRNAKGARLLGVEFEVRKSLGDLSRVFRQFSVIGNLTLAKSKINVDLGDPLIQVTNLSRPMVNQAPYVLNLALDYMNDALGTGVRVLYNVAGKRIVEVGTRGLPDSYEQPRHLIDVAVTQRLVDKFQLKLSGSNLLASKYTVTVGSANNASQIQYGYTDSRLFLFSGTYTY